MWKKIKTSKSFLAFSKKSIPFERWKALPFIIKKSLQNLDRPWRRWWEKLGWLLLRENFCISSSIETNATFDKLPTVRTLIHASEGSTFISKFLPHLWKVELRHWWKTFWSSRFLMEGNFKTNFVRIVLKKVERFWIKFPWKSSEL